MLFYISHSPDLCQNISGYSNISCSPCHMPIPYSPYLSASNSSTLVFPYPYIASFSALIPKKSWAGCSQHFLDRRIPSFCSAARHNSMIGRVVIYCATLYRVLVAYLPSAAPLGGETPLGISPTRGSEPMSRNQK